MMMMMMMLMMMMILASGSWLVAEVAGSRREKPGTHSERVQW